MTPYVTFNADAAAKGDIETLKAHGYDVRSANKEAGSVAAGINLIRGMFADSTLVIFKSCTPLISELGLYCYDKDKNSYTMRGGSWVYNVDDCRCTARYGYYPDSRYYGLGFRCVRT